MPKQAVWVLILVVTSVIPCTCSSRTKQPTRPGLLLGTSAADLGVPEQHRRPLRKLLRNGEEDYVHAVGASRFMYRFIAGTWLQFDSRAGYPGDNSKEICAKARMANACSKQQQNKLGLKEWPKEGKAGTPMDPVADMAAANAAIEQAVKLEGTSTRGDFTPRG